LTATAGLVGVCLDGWSPTNTARGVGRCLGKLGLRPSAVDGRLAIARRPAVCSHAIGLGVSVKIPRSAFDSDPAPRLDEQRRLGTSGRDSRPGFGEVTSGIGDGLHDVGQRSVRIVNAMLRCAWRG
jgi:hypothetical protein